MKIIADDIQKLKRLDKRLDKLGTTEENSDRRNRLSEKINGLKTKIFTELDDRTEKVNERIDKYLEGNTERTDDKKHTRLKDRLEHIDDRKEKINDSIGESDNWEYSDSNH